MINSISSSNINFQGRTFSRAEATEAVEAFDDFGAGLLSKGGKKAKKAITEIGSEHFRAYANIPNKKVCLVKKIFGYGLEKGSIELPIYKGPTSKEAGLSTETGGFGGGWIEGNLDTPLSTTDIHTCAGINLVDDLSERHIFYHVFHDTSANDIKVFIKEKMPRFNKINIISGDRHKTNETVNRILSATNEINPKSEKHFYHFATENPEVVAHKGDLSYVKGQKPENVTFKEVVQYFSPEVFD